MQKHGNIKISSENMMPIIKKWLYSDKDIFLREIVANGVDAITKFNKLVSMGEAQADENGYFIKINVDEKAKTLTVEDNGIGMTAEEVENYITQIAFSGASDFLEKYEKAGGDGIIGHFGLGFYSAYMVSERVEIVTKSYKNEPAVHWESDGNSDYTIEDCEKDGRGTKVIMHIAKEEKEFLNEGNIKNLVKKYCSFMPYNVYVNFKGDGKDEPLNNTTPLYTKPLKDCKDEDYKKFYTDTFMDYDEPIFWVHLNMDYPFRLKGILYFPKVKNKVELERGKVKLYCNQVFIADNIKEVIPEFLMLLNGVIDCPDIPLNVSRSFLQNDSQVRKISKHITKKVADKLIWLFKNDRKKFESCWGDLANFVKFGCIKDSEFYDKIKEIIIYKDINDKFLTVQELIPAQPEEDKAENKDNKEESKPATVYYVSDEEQQAQYIKLFKDQGLNAIKCDNFIDPHFLSFLEYRQPGKVKFVRIDGDIDGALKDGAEEDEVLKDIYKNSLKDDKITLKTEKLKNTDIPAVIVVDEYMRRYSEMGRFYGMSDSEIAKTLIINTSCPVNAKLKTLSGDKQEFVAGYVYLLALSAFKKLSNEEHDKFVKYNLMLLNGYID